MRGIIVLGIVLGMIAGISCKAAYLTKDALEINHKKVIPITDAHPVFDLDSVPTITLEVTTEEWNKLLANFDAFPDNEKYVKADFSFTKNRKSKHLYNIGFRIRGNCFSRAKPESSKKHVGESPKWNHSHLRLNFRKYNKDSYFYGLKSLNLKWFHGDPAMVREIYCYDMFKRAGVKLVPRASYVKLLVHIKEDNRYADFGIYEMVEPIDSRFLKARISKKKAKGFLWKCLSKQEGAADLVYSRMKGRMGCEDPDNGKNYAYDLKTRKKKLTNAIDQMTNFVYKLNTLEGDAFKTWVTNAIDVPQLLKVMAVNTLLGMWDDYWRGGNNYFLYFDNKGKCTFIPYDYDNTLGTARGRKVIVANVFEWGHLQSNRPLIAKLMAIPEYRRLYGKYVSKMVDEQEGELTPAKSIPRIKKWHKMIESYIDDDIEGFDKIIDAPSEWSSERTIRLISGGEKLEDEEVNYFALRATSAREQVKDEANYEARRVQGIKFVRNADGIVISIREYMKPKAVLTSKEGFKCRYKEMIMRGYFNDWGATPMKLVGDFTWEGIIEAKTDPKGRYSFKIASGTRWSVDDDWGEKSPENDGIADFNTGSKKHIKFGKPGKFKVSFDTETFKYTVVEMK